LIENVIICFIKHLWTFFCGQEIKYISDYGGENVERWNKKNVIYFIHWNDKANILSKIYTQTIRVLQLNANVKLTSIRIWILKFIFIILFLTEIYFQDLFDLWIENEMWGSRIIAKLRLEILRIWCLLWGMMKCRWYEFKFWWIFEIVTKTGTNIALNCF